MFSRTFLRINDFFYNLPEFNIKVDWVLSHNFD